MGCDIHAVIQVKARDRWSTERVASTYRNYDTFAVLANVRNGEGFAGHKTGEKWPYIDNPRGLPDDKNSIEIIFNYRAKVVCPHCFNGEFLFGDHSWSHVSLKEMKDMEGKLDDMGNRTRCIVVERQDYIDYKEHGKEFTSWCTNVFGNGVYIVEEDHFIPSDTTMTHVRINESLHWKKQATLFSELIEEMNKVRMQWWNAIDADVRLVFGFDS